MRSRAITAAKYLLAGGFLNLLFAWVCVCAHGRVLFEWKPYHNPRQGNPVAFFVNQRFGAEWVVGCGRPGTLVGRYPESVKTYRRAAWWPPEAVTFDDREFGVAAGWPLLTLSGWRTVTTTVRPADKGLDVHRVDHWGVALSDTAKGGADEFPPILPLRPIWPGLIANTLVYAIALGIATGVWRTVRRHRRRRRGLCVACGYPAGPSDTCSECGQCHSSTCPSIPRRVARKPY